MEASSHDFDWLRHTLKSSLADEAGIFYEATAGHHGGGGGPPLEPWKREYLLRLITAIRAGRSIAGTYNYVLLGVLLVLAVRYRATRYLNARKWASRHRIQPVIAVDEDAASEGGASSSGSSTIQGNTTPPDAAKDAEFDAELAPLLDPSRKGTRRRQRALYGRLRGWLAYQPPAVPIINRQLPSNGTTLFVLAFYALNAAYLFYEMPLAPQYSFAFADRAAIVFVVNLPLLYILAAKNQPLKYLTGRSYESLNILHRRVGELLCFMAFVHFAGMLAYQLVFCPDWFRKRTFTEFLSERLVLLGIGAFVSYEALYLTSLGTFRKRCYEVFLACHVVLQIAALAFLWLHFPTARQYVQMALIIFIIDRIVWRLCMKSSRIEADLTVLPDGETLMLSANWDIPKQGRWLAVLPKRNSIKQGWKPTDHVFLSVPELGRAHSLQAHPFTIASAAPDAALDGGATHAWFNLLIRAHSGFTRDLLGHAHQKTSVVTRIEGPYGSSRAINTMRASDDVVLVAGGSGIAVVFPVAWSLVMGSRPASFKAARAPRVHLLWIMHAEDHHHWVPSHILDELVAAGLDLVIPSATSVAGRPDVAAVLREWIDEAQVHGYDTGVMVSGPDGLNRLVRNTAAMKMAEGATVHVEVEKFGW